MVNISFYKTCGIIFSIEENGFLNPFSSSMMKKMKKILNEKKIFFKYKNNKTYNIQHSEISRI